MQGVQGYVWLKLITPTIIVPTDHGFWKPRGACSALLLGGLLARTLRLVRSLRMAGRTMQEFPLSGDYLILARRISAPAAACSRAPPARDSGTIHPGRALSLWGSHRAA